MNILLIEPRRQLARIYQEALELAGHKVWLAHNAQSAITELDGQLVDKIILELQLVSHSGVEFLYELRSYPEWQHIPVIIHSMVPSEALKKSQGILDTLGVKQYLYKPFTRLQDLTRAVAAI